MTRERLCDEIGRRKLTVTAAARVLRVSRVHLSRMMSGARGISPDRADLIRLRLAEYDAGKSPVGGNP